MKLHIIPTIKRERAKMKNKSDVQCIISCIWNIVCHVIGYKDYTHMLHVFLNSNTARHWSLACHAGKAVITVVEDSDESSISKLCDRGIEVLQLNLPFLLLFM